MKIKLLTAVGLTAVVLLGAIGLPSAAVASDAKNLESGFSQTQLNELRSNMDQLGITSENQATIIHNMELGKAPDSTTGATPITTVQNDVAGTRVTTSTFADGSISKTSVQLPKAAPSDGGIQPMSVAGCQMVDGGLWIYYNACEVETNQATFRIKFLADVKVGNAGGLYSQITRAYGQQSNCVGCNSSTAPVTEILQATQTASSPASARAYFQMNFPSYSTTGSVTLKVTYATLSDTSP